MAKLKLFTTNKLYRVGEQHRPLHLTSFLQFWKFSRCDRYGACLSILWGSLSERCNAFPFWMLPGLEDKKKEKKRRKRRMKTLLKEFNSYPEVSRAVYGTTSAVIPVSRPVRGPYRDSFNPPPVAWRLKLIAARHGCSGRIWCLDQSVGASQWCGTIHTSPGLTLGAVLSFCRMALKCVALSAWNTCILPANSCCNGATTAPQACNLRWILPVLSHHTVVSVSQLRISC